MSRFREAPQNSTVIELHDPSLLNLFNNTQLRSLIRLTTAPYRAPPSGSQRQSTNSSVKSEESDDDDYITEDEYDEEYDSEYEDYHKKDNSKREEEERKRREQLEKKKVELELKKKKQEEQRRKQLEEDERKKREQIERARHDEEQRKRKEEERKKQEEEEKRKRKEEADRKKREDDERRKIVEEERKKKEEERLRREEEEKKERKRLKEEERKKRREEKRKKQEEEEKKKAELKERQKKDAEERKKKQQEEEEKKRLQNEKEQEERRVQEENAQIEEAKRRREIEDMEERWRREEEEEKYKRQQVDSQKQLQENRKKQDEYIRRAESAASDITTIYISNIPYDPSENYLRDLCEKFGPVVAIKKHNQPYGFVQFQNREDAEHAINELHHYDRGGERITVRWATRQVKSFTEREGKQLPPSPERGVSPQLQNNTKTATIHGRNVVQKPTTIGADHDDDDDKRAFKKFDRSQREPIQPPQPIQQQPIQPLFQQPIQQPITRQNGLFGEQDIWQIPIIQPSTQQFIQPPRLQPLEEEDNKAKIAIKRTIEGYRLFFVEKRRTIDLDLTKLQVAHILSGMWNALTDEERDVYNKQADAQTQPIQRPTPIVAQQLFNQQSVVQPLTQAPLARAPLDRKKNMKKNNRGDLDEQTEQHLLRVTLETIRDADTLVLPLAEIGLWFKEYDPNKKNFKDYTSMKFKDFLLRHPDRFELLDLDMIGSEKVRLLI